MKKPTASVRKLPEKANLEHLKKQARALHKRVLRGDRAALERVRLHHPRASAQEKHDTERFSLSDAQLVIAREYGFVSYPKLKTHVERVSKEAAARATHSPLPVAVLHERQVLPGAEDWGGPASGRFLSAVEAAFAARSPLFYVLAREPGTLGRNQSELHAIGALVRVESIKPAPDGKPRVHLRCTGRARLVELCTGDAFDLARVETLPALTWSKRAADRVAQQLYWRLESFARHTEWFSRIELARLLASKRVEALIAYAARLCGPTVQQTLLEQSDPEALVGALCAALDALAPPPVPRAVGSTQAKPDVADALAEAYLVVLYAEDHPHLLGRRFALHKPVTSCGRDATNDVVLHSDAVSRVHATIERNDEGFVLVDQRSTNGTHVEGLAEPLKDSQEYLLEDGERIALGGVVLQFLEGGDLEAKCRAAADYVHERDGLTGLLNRERWLARVEREVLSARGSERGLCLLMLGLDQSATLQLEFGRLAVNGVLRQVAKVLERELGANALIGRHASDGFGVVLSGTDGASAASIAKRLCEAAGAQPVPLGGPLDAGAPPLSVTFSAGVATLYQSTGRDELIADARAALQRAQRAGRGQVRGPVGAAA